MCRSLSGKLWESGKELRGWEVLWVEKALRGLVPFGGCQVWFMRSRLCINLGGIDGVAWWHFREAKGWPAGCKYRKARRTYQSSMAIMMLQLLYV